MRSVITGTRRSGEDSDGPMLCGFVERDGGIASLHADRDRSRAGLRRPWRRAERIWSLWQECFGRGAGLSQTQMRWIWETYLKRPEQQSHAVPHPFSQTSPACRQRV